MNSESIVASKSPCAKYQIFSARLVAGKLMHPLLTGFAVQFEGDAHYVIRFSMFPGMPYYLCKNYESQTNYTVFAKCLKDQESGKLRFQNPIGSGKLLDELKSHLELRFPLLGTSVFMDLFPRS